MENQVKVAIKKPVNKVSEEAKKAFLFQNNDGEPILSFTPKACYYRAIHRPEVDRLFDKSHRVFPYNPQQGWEINKKARRLWREIIRESNKF